MTSKAPASAALLAQAVGDVAPFLGSSNRPTPTRELSQDEAMLARTEDTPMTPIEKVPNPRPSWTEVLAGPLGSTRRLVAFHLAALVLSTVVRSVAFSPHLGFGNYLLENLAPVERDGVRWPWIVAMRAAEIAAGAALWKRVRGEAKKDGGEVARDSVLTAVLIPFARIQPCSGSCSRSSRGFRSTVGLSPSCCRDEDRPAHSQHFDPSSFRAHLFLAQVRPFCRVSRPEPSWRWTAAAAQELTLAPTVAPQHADGNRPSRHRHLDLRRRLRSAAPPPAAPARAPPDALRL